jgi:citrate lyase beta subunit
MKPVRTALFAPGIKERVMTKALESAYYQKVVVEFAAAEKAGTAAIAVDGKLVDYAMAQRARRVLELAKLDRPR